jgi:hypothetical protein
MILICVFSLHSTFTQWKYLLRVETVDTIDQCQPFRIWDLSIQIVETVDTIDQCQPFRIWDLSIQIVETVDTIYILINVSHLEFEIKFSYRLYTLIYYMIQQTIRSCVFIPFETYIKSNTSKCILIYQIVRAVGLGIFVLFVFAFSYDVWWKIKPNNKWIDCLYLFLKIRMVKLNVNVCFSKFVWSNWTSSWCNYMT